MMASVTMDPLRVCFHVLTGFDEDGERRTQVENKEHVFRPPSETLSDFLQRTSSWPTLTWLFPLWPLFLLTFWDCFPKCVKSVFPPPPAVDAIRPQACSPVTMKPTDFPRLWRLPCDCLCGSTPWQVWLHRASWAGQGWRRCYGVWDPALHKLSLV